MDDPDIRFYLFSVGQMTSCPWYRGGTLLAEQAELFFSSLSSLVAWQNTSTTCLQSTSISLKQRNGLERVLAESFFKIYFWDCMRLFLVKLRNYARQALISLDSCFKYYPALLQFQLALAEHIHESLTELQILHWSIVFSYSWHILFHWLIMCVRR